MTQPTDTPLTALRALYDAYNVNADPQRIQRAWDNARITLAAYEHTDWTPEQIKGLRHDLALSQTQLAEKLGVHFNTIRRWEQGNGSPKPENSAQLRQLAERK